LTRAPSPEEAHVASIPSSDKKINSDVTFIVGANDGFTGRLSRIAKSHGGRFEVPAYLDGPYGTIASIDSYSSVVLVAGGTGVSYTLPLALQLVRLAQEGSSAVSSLTFVWCVKNVEHIAWISSTLLQLRHDCPSSLVLDIKIFVTQALVNELGTASSSDHESSSDEEITSEEGRSSPDSGEVNEKMAVAERNAEKLGAELDHSGGRPDFSTLLGSIIKDAAGGAVAVNVCGPSTLTTSVRTALNSSDGPYKVKDVWNGGSSVTLHTESFGW
ncbi:ferric reductase NAD binding domain-containing protein, partial [Mrakia frigida]|uniref:ferric reductase NAD binding domain-containing protein n=1 Tax=Mrakia frigida TaxID=29902 RepID=UPI003FCC1F67